MGSFCGHAMMDLNKFMLPETHPAITELYAELMRSSSIRRGTGAATSLKWVDRHIAQCQRLGINWLSSKIPPEMYSCFPGLLQIRQREIDVLLFKGVKIPSRTDSHVKDKVVEISQNVGEISQIGGTSRKYSFGGANVAPCCLPKSELFHNGRCRLLRGVELLHLQGIYYDDDEFLTLTENNVELADLAGNAFCTDCFAAIYLSLQVAIATLRADTAEPTVELVEPTVEALFEGHEAQFLERRSHLACVVGGAIDHSDPDEVLLVECDVGCAPPPKRPRRSFSDKLEARRKTRQAFGFGP